MSLLAPMQQDGWEIVGTGKVMPVDTGNSYAVPEGSRVGLLWRHVGTGCLYAEEMRVPPGKREWASLLAFFLLSFGYEPHVVDVPRYGTAPVSVLVSRHPLLSYQVSTSGPSIGRKKRRRSNGGQADPSSG